MTRRRSKNGVPVAHSSLETQELAEERRAECCPPLS